MNIVIYLCDPLFLFIQREKITIFLYCYISLFFKLDFALVLFGQRRRLHWVPMGWMPGKYQGPLFSESNSEIKLGGLAYLTSKQSSKFGDLKFE